MSFSDLDIERTFKLKPMVVRNAKVKFISLLVEAMAESLNGDYMAAMMQIAEGLRGETPEHIFGMCNQKLQEKIRNRVKRNL